MSIPPYERMSVYQILTTAKLSGLCEVNDLCLGVVSQQCPQEQVTGLSVQVGGGDKGNGDGESCRGQCGPKSELSMLRSGYDTGRPGPSPDGDGVVVVSKSERLK